jgi:hypothetical protein
MGPANQLRSEEGVDFINQVLIKERPKQPRAGLKHDLSHSAPSKFTENVSQIHRNFTTRFKNLDSQFTQPRFGRFATPL